MGKVKETFIEQTEKCETNKSAGSACSIGKGEDLLQTASPAGIANLELKVRC